jgi:hypothetical protein
VDYLCQVPWLKALQNLIVSVLVADLVFLQVVWQSYKLAVEYFFVKKDARRQWCEGREDSVEGSILAQRMSGEDLS